MATIIVDKIVRIIKNRKRLEKALNLKIENKGTEVTITGKPEDEYIGLKVLDALNLGFSFSDAISIKTEDNELDILNIKDYTRKKDTEKVIGRLIGKGGKVLKTLSDLTKCSLEVKGHEIGIIGNAEEIKPALDSIIQVIHGSKHANIYKNLEKRKKEPIFDLGLKKKDKNL